ncbi:MAG: serine hydrolase [Propionibacterium sp.]|nr:serine hydrolase [Propionibacterium sp.]
MTDRTTHSDVTSSDTADALDPFRRTSPSRAGVDADGILDFLQAQADAGLDVHSFVLLRGGAVLAEGWAAPYLPANRQLLYSLSKTFTSAAMGIAVAEGLCGYDDLLVDHFPDLADGASPVARTIRIRDALAMATGHTVDMHPLDAPLTRSSLRTLFVPGPDGRPGVTFAYNQLATYSVARIVEQTSGMPLLDFLEDRLFSKLGIGEAGWMGDADGLALGFSGLHLRTGSIASFFQLLADDGIRDGVRLLPEEWIAEHRRKHVETAGQGNPDWSQGYGWQCWMARHGYRGDGAFGQYGIVLRDLDTVIAMTGEQENMQALLDLLWQHVLPAIGREGSAAADERLADWVDGWWLDPVSGATPGVVSGGDGMGGRIDIDGDTLTWTDRDGVVNTSPLGVDDSWTIDSWRWPHGRIDVALSAGRRGDATVVRVVVTSTPHSFTWTLRPGVPTDFVWRFAPLHGPGPQQLALP